MLIETVNTYFLTAIRTSRNAISVFFPPCQTALKINRELVSVSQELHVCQVSVRNFGNRLGTNNSQSQSCDSAGCLFPFEKVLRKKMLEISREEMGKRNVIP